MQLTVLKDYKEKKSKLIYLLIKAHVKKNTIRQYTFFFGLFIIQV